MTCCLLCVVCRVLVCWFVGLFLVCGLFVVCLLFVCTSLFVGCCLCFFDVCWLLLDVYYLSAIVCCCLLFVVDCVLLGDA